MAARWMADPSRADTALAGQYTLAVDRQDRRLFERTRKERAGRVRLVVPRKQDRPAVGATQPAIASGNARSVSAPASTTRGREGDFAASHAARALAEIAPIAPTARLTMRMMRWP